MRSPLCDSCPYVSWEVCLGVAFSHLAGGYPWSIGGKFARVIMP